MINVNEAAAYIFPKATWHLPRKEQVLYLTFDDGPTPGVTEQVLDILAEYNAKATFFCLGANAEAYPELVERIKQEGHAIGHHSHSHCNGWQTPTTDYMQDVSKGHSVVPSKLFRPPYGRMRWKQYRKLSEQYNIIMWDVLSHDFDETMSCREVLDMVKLDSQPGSIVVFHDSEKAWPRLQGALPCALSWFSSLGYRFDAITEELCK